MGVEILVGGDVDIDILLLFPKYTSLSGVNVRNQSFLRSTMVGRLGRLRPDTGPDILGLEQENKEV
jgi:hypothetical protein